MRKISVIIPAYNEQNTILEILKRVCEAKTNTKKEIIIIDDGSKDNTSAIVRRFINKNKYGSDIRLIKKENGGKGSAIKEGFKHSTGDILIVQDADLEYDPNDYQDLINPIINKRFKVVYGSRLLNKKNKAISFLPFYFGGIIVTKITNLLFKSKLTDEPTCYKVFDKSVINEFKIESNGFEWEPEITAKLLKKGIKIHEVPISYYPRTKLEGKKINWKDGLQAIWTLFYWRFKKV